MTSRLRSGVRAGLARTSTSPCQTAAVPWEARPLPTRAPGSPSLRWRRRQLAHISPPALPGVVASGGGSRVGRRKQKGKGSSDPPVQRGPRRVQERDNQEANTTRNTGGDSRTKQRHIRALRRARPGNDVSGGRGGKGRSSKWTLPPP